jgi:type II secretory pathway component GspD/PulD (secretin)
MTSLRHSPGRPRKRVTTRSGPVARAAVLAVPVFFVSLLTPRLSVVSAFAQDRNEPSTPVPVSAPTKPQNPALVPAPAPSVSPLEQKLPAPPRKSDVKKGKQAYKQALKLEDQGDWQAAYDAYSDAVNWDPSNREYLVRQAVAKGHVVQMKVDLAEREAVSGRLTSALHAMRQARELDPSNRTVQERLTELEALDPAHARQVVSEPELAPEVQLEHQPGTQDFQLRGQTQSAYQEVAQRFGVEVAFDVDMRNGPVHLDLQDADFATVMRVLGEETGTFWRPLTKHLFFVAQDTQQKRKDYDVSIVRTVLLSASETNEQMTELSRMVREVAGITRTDLDSKSHTLTMRASPQAVAVATGIIDDLEQPSAELVLEIEVLEVDRSHNVDLGITGPQTATIYSIPSNAQQLIAEGGATALNALLEQVFGSSSSIPPVFAFGGGKTTFLGTLPGAAASFSNLLSTVRAGRRVLLRAEDGQPASFFVGERYPVSLAQYSSSLVGNAKSTPTQTATVSGSTASSVPITTLTTGNNPDFVVTGDVNNDNFQDIVAANFTDGTLSVFLGDGLGTFANPSTVTVGKGPTWIAEGNFNAKTNSSGIIDLAVANQVDNTVSILLGNGDGTFTAAPSSPLMLPSGSSPTSIAVGDFNKDGYSDLAVVNMAANTISIFLGNGDGTFKTPTTIVTGNAPTSIVAEAFNPSNPSLIDLAVTNSADNTLEIFIGNGDGTFQKGVTYATGVTPLYVASADLNVDGNLDLAVADSGVATSSNTVGNSVSIFLGNGDGTFILPGGTRLDYPAGTNPTSITIADFNDDGLPDLVVTATGDNSFALLLGAGGGTFDSPIEVPVGTTPDSGATADFNGDGLPDLAISNYGSNSVSVILDSSSLISLLSSSGVGTQFPGAEYLDIGLKVKATPRVHPDGDVTLQFEFTLSSLAGSSLNNIPVVNNQEIHQTVRVHTDQTAALAGYLAPQRTTSLNGSPGLGDLPLNGIIGGTTNSQYSDTELLILVTPRTVEMAAPRKDHVIYAGRGQLGGATSLGPTIQERRGGFELPEGERRIPQPQPEPQPQVQPPPEVPQPATGEPQPATPPPANTPPEQQQYNQEPPH